MIQPLKLAELSFKINIFFITLFFYSVSDLIKLKYRKYNVYFGRIFISTLFF